MELLNPRVDVAFKKIFGSEENKDLLISFINSIFSHEDQVIDVELLNPYNSRNFNKDESLAMILPRIKTSLDRWAAFLTKASSLEPNALPKELDDPCIKKAVDVLINASLNKQEWELYEGHLKWMRTEAMEQILCPLSEHAKNSPHHPALIFDEGIWSYLELDGVINSLCDFLKGIGIQEHQRVAFIAHSNPSTVMLLWALFRLGAIACPLSFRTPQDQIAKSIEYLKASHVLDPNALLLEKGRWTTDCKIKINAPATLLYTSGTSGVPKVACHTFGNHYYNAMGAAPQLRLENTSRWLLSLPLFHVSGLGILFRCFTKGATVVLSSSPQVQAIPKFQITHLSLVPTQLYRLLQEPESNLGIKCILLGGAPISDALLHRASHLPIFSTYGMTEMSSMITLSSKLLPFAEMKIENDHEIWVRGKTLFQGYWDPITETVIKHPAGQWFPTKDLGRLNSDGDLEIIGRKDRQFISGGENIQPEEIEKALCAIAGIRQASVLPIEDKEFGQRPVAFIDDATGQHTLQTIRDALQFSLPSFKHPVAIFPYPMDTDLKPNLSTMKNYTNPRK